MMTLPRAKKQFGQHFLTDRYFIERILALIDAQADDSLVEIGPGPGALTGPLLQHLNHLHVVEIDRDLAAQLRRQYAPEHITVHEIDVLKFDFSVLPDPFRCVGNLPYNISTPFLFHLATFAQTLQDATFMLQREVVERMVADPGTPAYGRLSVMLQYRFQMTQHFVVPPGAFTPPPKVDSAIVTLRPLPPNRLRARDDARFAAIVTAGFGQRRKTLGNALKDYVSSAVMMPLGIDPKRRAETLSVSEFVRLADAEPVPVS